MRAGGKALWLGRTLFFTLFFLNVSSIFAHQPNPPAAHIDVYFDGSASGNFDLQCQGTSGWTDPSGDAVALSIASNATESTIAIDAVAGSPKTAVMIVLRNTDWPNNAGNCSVETYELKIKRIKLDAQGNKIESEVVRTISDAGIQASGCPLQYCVQWNGEINVDGQGFGRVNGAYELEIKITSASVDNTLERTLIYPGSNQLPIKVDTMDIKNIVSSPTVVGGAAVFPWNINFKMAKSGQVTIDIFKGSDAGCGVQLSTQTGNNTTDLHQYPLPTCPQFVRRLKTPTDVAEGEMGTDGRISFGASWDGRDNAGQLVSSGVYVATIRAWDPNSGDETDHNPPHDEAFVSTFTLAVDPLQITNLNVQPLDAASTAFAGVGFQLTEPAKVIFDIWQTSAAFADINAAPPILPNNGALLVRRIEQVFNKWTPSSIIWDGRDGGGRFVDDGNYVYTIWAHENESGGINSTRTVRTSRARIGIIPVTRGLIPASQVFVESSVLGTPAVSAIAPFKFTYSIGRDGLVRLKVLAQNNQFLSDHCTTKICTNPSGCLVANLVSGETRPGNHTLITDPPTLQGWDGRTIGLPAGNGICDNGIRLSSGVYAAELNVIDPLFTDRVSTRTVLFPINLLRVINVQTTPLLSGATDSATISYVLSEAMNMRWEIYPPTTTFTGTWPNLTATQPAVRTIFGPRPGKVSLTEFWDGRNESGFFVPDGNYISLLKAQDSYGAFATDPVLRELVVARGQISILNPLVSPTFPTAQNSSATLQIPLAPYEIAYTLSREANVTISIKTQTGVFITSITNSEPRSGSVRNKEFWDGTNFTGQRVNSGSLFVDIFAQDQASVHASSSVARIPLSVNLLRIYDAAITPLTPNAQAAEISYQLSEPLNIDLRIYKPGTVFNMAGQPVPPESESLVFRIHGPRPSRVPVSEVWPGINLFQKQVQDGNYVFRLIAQDHNGNQAADMITGEISVLRLGFADPQSTFDEQTFAYPNPAKNPPVKICTLVPVDAYVHVKIYTLSGELIWQKELGFQSGGTALCGNKAIQWNMENSWGRRVARGVYFYVLRADSVGGNRQFLQTRKKILIP